MSKTPNIFVRSLRELKSTRCLALTALLVAANLALDLMGLELRLPPDLKIGFGFLTNASIGMLFGPSVAMMAACAPTCWAILSAAALQWAAISRALR